MKALFIGGTGTISSACSVEALARGVDLYHLNRGHRQAKSGDLTGVKTIHADVRDEAQAAAALEKHTFDVVVDFVAFTPEHIETDLRLFTNRCGQFIFISSASTYQKPPTTFPITESTPLHNPFWEYSRNKIACEDRLMRAYREGVFPMTIVRPSHTYGDGWIPCAVGGSSYQPADRILRGLPVITPGDGTSLWTLTHSSDYARAFVCLMSNAQAIGHAIHITSDEWLTWDQIVGELGRALGVEPNIMHLPSDFVAQIDPAMGPGLLGDKAHCTIFDNSKIKQFAPGWTANVPYRRGLRDSLNWFEADPARKQVDEKVHERLDKILAAWSQVG